MKRLTLQDKHLLRRMMSAASAHMECESRCGGVSYIEAAERAEAFERELNKIVPLGRLPELKKPLWRDS